MYKRTVGGILIASGEERVTLMARSEEHTSELQSHVNLVCRLLLEKKNYNSATVLGVGPHGALMVIAAGGSPLVSMSLRCEFRVAREVACAGAVTAGPRVGPAPVCG